MRSTEMKLIGAGLPRTATTSQKIALEMLGLAPCYHMVNVLGNLDEVPRWRRGMDGEAVWEEILAGFQATVDWPGAYFYEQLLHAHPDAKVLLSVRDPEPWVESMRATIWGVLYGDSLVHDLSAARERVEPRWRAYTELTEEMWRRSGLLSDDGDRAPSGEAMLAYNERVKATVPAERLLVWSASDGWEPLCEFLGLPAPEQPFPRANDTEQFSERLIDASLQSLQQWRASR
jgi:sulfotransferase family protein